MVRSRLCAAAVLVLTGSPVLAAASGFDSLQPHRAVYDLALAQAEERSGIAGIYGRMVYEFKGSACAGYTTNFRFVTRIDTGEENRLSDQQTTTYEDVKARKFRFTTKTFTDRQLDREVTGKAEDAGNRIAVSLENPSKREVELEEGRFPTEHMLDLLEHARAGDHVFEARIFDGSDNADQTMMATTVIGKKLTPKEGEADDKVIGALAKSEFWPVTIAYFNDNQSADALPTYRMAFKLYDNGIIRDILMDYSDYALKGRLTRLELLDPEPCPSAN